VVHRGGSGTVARHKSNTIYYSGRAARHVRTGTAVAVGTRVAVRPRGCSIFSTSGYTYYLCGTVFYQPHYEGDSVVYVVVDKP